MKITALTAQQRDPDRVNVLVDGKYRFSLDISQIIDLSIKIGKEYSESELQKLENESRFGKIYGRALEYCLSRPHSSKEVRDYLYKKTFASRSKDGKTKPGITKELAGRVFDRLLDKGYIDDEKFTKFWIENRFQSKGISTKKLTVELRAKGIPSDIISRLLAVSDRNDQSELEKIIAKKRSKYQDNQKFAMYLVRLGFNYDDIKQALSIDS